MGNKNPSERSTGALPTKEEKKLQPKRTEIFKEIVSTERSYVKALNELNEVWHLPLIGACKAGKPIISEKEINNIFTISEGILCLHQNLLKSLEIALNDWDENQTIGDIFIRNANALKLYTEYINRYGVSVETLNNAISQPSFKEFAKSRCRGNPIHVLSSLLIQPIQRIPRYEMLLKDLLKCTWMSHPDYDNLEGAVEKIVEAAAFNNEQKRKAESLMRLLEIQNELEEVVQIHSSGRQIIKDGQIKIPNTKESSRRGKGKKRKTVNYCLMDDKLLIWDAKVVLFFDDLPEINFKDHTEQNLVVFFTKTSDQEITLYFKKLEDKDQWLETFRKAKKEKQTRDNQIQKAVFIVPANPVSEKEPLLPANEINQNQWCCNIL